MAFTSLGPNLPDFKLEIAFASTPLDDTPSWDDVTAYCREATIKRGRSFELDQNQAGLADFVLDNRDRRFDPEYDSGPYFPNVIPTRQIRFTARYNAVEYVQFKGYSSGFPQDWPGHGADALVRINAIDAFTLLNRYEFDADDAYAEQLSGARVAAVLSDFGFAVGDTDVDAGQSIMAAQAAGSLEGQSALSHLLSVAESENGLFFITRTGLVRFEDRHHRLLNETTPRENFHDADGSGGIAYQDLVTSHDEEQLWNIVRIETVGGPASAEDATSRTNHGPRVLSKSFVLASAVEGQSAAEYMIQKYATARLRIPRIVVQGRRSAAVSWPILLDLELSQRFDVERRPSGATDPISGEMHTESYQHVIRPKFWETSIEFSPADATAYWILGTAGFSELGETTRLAY